MATRRQPEHASQGDPCTACGVAAASHRIRARKRPEHGIPADGSPCTCGVPNGAHVERTRPAGRDRIIGLDGEGVGRDPHKYVYLAASDTTGLVLDTENPAGLSTEACFDFILAMPERALIVGYFLGYDFTMMLRDLPDRALFDLYHPAERRVHRKGREIFKSVRWRGYAINLVNRRLTVRRGNKRRTVWDIGTFFQCAFVKALDDWRIAPETRAAIAGMKERRSDFDKVDPAEIQHYCRAECRALAQLATALLDAHDAAGLHLTQYNGPGSTASVLLDRLGIREKRGEVPDEVRHALACAFFGGRFEHSHIGTVQGPIYGYDLANAYPYAATDMPCLCGATYRRVTGRTLSREIERASMAIVRWHGGGGGSTSWGALPMRDARGSIVFPLRASEGGWAWSCEYLAALQLGGYEASAAWIVEQGCDHDPPFAPLGGVYRQRVQLGKDGAGRVLKLAACSVYGKLAQSIGKPRFQSWVWAGWITAATRAELLRAIVAARNGWHVLAVATDGLYSTERLQLRAPRDTGTSDLLKPLGVWEEKVIESGIFLARPGVYFPLDGSESETKARGVGAAALYRARDAIVAALARGDESVTVGGMQRFWGAKSCLREDSEGVATRDAKYGTWAPHAIKLGFAPQPKRAAVGRGGRLMPFQAIGYESQAYNRAAPPSPEAIALGIAEEVLAEQPDGDFTSGLD